MFCFTKLEARGIYERSRKHTIFELITIDREFLYARRAKARCSRLPGPQDTQRPKRRLRRSAREVKNDGPLHRNHFFGRGAR